MKHLYEPDVPTTTRDGVTLRADVWRPAEGTAPTLLMRTPYGRRQTGMYGAAGGGPSVMGFVNAGYAVVIQDVRGTFASDGVFEPLVNETTDGVDTLAWIAGQDWYDGTVGTFGVSYMGMTQWAVAVGNPAGLKAFAPFFTASDTYSAPWYSPGGALSLSNVNGWRALMSAFGEMRALQRGDTTDPSALMRLQGYLVDPLSLNDDTPADHSVLANDGWGGDWLAHPDRDAFWDARGWASNVSSVTAPALMTGGWYDLMISETVADFVRMRTQAGSEHAREATRLVIGPWHHQARTGEFQDRFFGPLAPVDLTESHVAFYDEHLRGKTPASPAPRVRIFVMGVDQWRDEQDWPLPGTRYVDYHLHSEGAANTRDGDGTLELDAPTTAASDALRYDPRDPVPTAGGALLPTFPGLVGPVDQRVVDDRPDVLCYTGPVLTEAVEVTGLVKLQVFVSSTAVDTDITAKLVDVFPDGRAINLCDGIFRLRHRNGLSGQELMTPGEVYEVTVPMSVTSNVFLPGHRIRVDVSSSNFPHYDRNSNTGGAISTETLADMVVANNTIHHGGARPSRLVLPVIDR